MQRFHDAKVLEFIQDILDHGRANRLHILVRFHRGFVRNQDIDADLSFLHFPNIPIYDHTHSLLGFLNGLLDQSTKLLFTQCVVFFGMVEPIH